MDKMSILKLLLVTLPESIMNIYIALLITGDRLKLPLMGSKNDKYRNIIKLLIAIALMSLVQFIGRSLINDMYTYFIYNVILTIIVFRIIYSNYTYINKDKRILTKINIHLNLWKKPIMQVGIIILTLLTIENIYLPPTMRLLKIDTMKEAYQIPWVNLVLPQIDRFFQILIISLTWQYKRISQNIRNYNCNKTLFLVIFSYIIVLEFSLSYLYINYFEILSNVLQILFFILLSAMSVINVMAYKFSLNMIDRIHYQHAKKGEGSFEKNK